MLIGIEDTTSYNSTSDQYSAALYHDKLRANAPLQVRSASSTIHGSAVNIECLDASKMIG